MLGFVFKVSILHRSCLGFSYIGLFSPFAKPVHKIVKTHTRLHYTLVCLVWSGPNFSLTRAAWPKAAKEGGSGGPLPENFWKLEAKFCILGTFGIVSHEIMLDEWKNGIYVHEGNFVNIQQSLWGSTSTWLYSSIIIIITYQNRFKRQTVLSVSLSIPWLQFLENILSKCV